MENSTYHKKIEITYQKIQYYQQLMILSTDPHHKMYFGSLMNNEMVKLNNLLWYYHQTNNLRSQENRNSSNNQREFTIEELSQFDGSGGRPAYVAINGTVYDVSLEATWGGGTHFSLYAGKDLSAQFNGCHGGRTEILRNLPIVGVLKA